MVMPVNENVHINLTSSDVIHGFYVHAFNFSRYALPGVLNQFTFRAVIPAPTTASAPNSAVSTTRSCGSRSKWSPTVPTARGCRATPTQAAAAKAAGTATNQQTSSIVPTKPTIGNS
jgi:hypothetical protein